MHYCKAHPSDRGTTIGGCRELQPKLVEAVGFELEVKGKQRAARAGCIGFGSKLRKHAPTTCSCTAPTPQLTLRPLENGCENGAAPPDSSPRGPNICREVVHCMLIFVPGGEGGIFKERQHWSGGRDSTTTCLPGQARVRQIRHSGWRLWPRRRGTLPERAGRTICECSHKVRGHNDLQSVSAPVLHANKARAGSSGTPRPTTGGSRSPAATCSSLTASCCERGWQGPAALASTAAAASCRMRSSTSVTMASLLPGGR